MNDLLKALHSNLTQLEMKQPDRYLAMKQTLQRAWWNASAFPRSSNRSHGYSETIAQGQIDDSNPWYFRLGVAIINEQAPSRAMRANGCAFSMAGELKPDFDSPPMFAQSRPFIAFRFDKLRNCRFFNYSKAISWAGDVHHKLLWRILPMKCHRA